MGSPGGFPAARFPCRPDEAAGRSGPPSGERRMHVKANRRRTLLRVVAGTVLAFGVSLLSDRGHADIIYTFGVKLQLTYIQATRAGKQTVDPEIIPSIKSALIRQFKWKYKNYTKLGQDTRQVRFGAAEAYELPNGKQMGVTIVSHRKEELNFKIQLDLDIKLPTLMNGEHWILVVGDDPDPLIVVFTPELIQRQRGD
jgi:hypothetical protein